MSRDGQLPPGVTEIQYVVSLMEKNYEAVGFIPRPRLSYYAERGQLLMETENQDLCGYLVFGAGFPKLRIYQACIQYDARRREHGLNLVKRLIQTALADEKITGDDLRQILSQLPVKELKSRTAMIAIEAASMLFDTTTGKPVDLTQAPVVLAAAHGILDGMGVGLGK